MTASDDNIRGNITSINHRRNAWSKKREMKMKTQRVPHDLGHL